MDAPAGSNPGGGTRFSLLHNVQGASSSITDAKRPEHEVNHFTSI